MLYVPTTTTVLPGTAKMYVFKFKPAAGPATANLRATLIAYRLNRFLQ
jgi:hypothetical protein